MTTRRFSRAAFVAALLDRGRAVPGDLRSPSGSPAGRRFDIYRNNVFVSLIEALESRYPVSRTLVGEDFFRAMACLYVELSPPRSRVLLTYGSDFADFVETFPPAASIPYLSDVIRLENARVTAFHARDAEPLSTAAMASVTSCNWAQARVVLHPSLTVVRSHYPVVSIWEAHQQPRMPTQIDDAGPEDAAVARPFQDVVVQRLPPGGAAFLARLSEGDTFHDAAIAAATADRKFDLVQALTILITSRIVIAISDEDSESGGPRNSAG
jgi:hypothetical protein